MFDKILIANRGEIVVRVIATCREMGIKTVAVYSEADRSALHVLEADEAVCLGPSAPAESYLNMDKIIAAAKQTGAQAIHPGYGFLAENARFAEICETCKVKFIGPSAALIAMMGDKATARATAVANGVPVTPGSVGVLVDEDKALAEARRIGFPVMVKATAGGGGKGMRIVHSAEDLREATESASREAKSAFGNGEIYLEKYLHQPRHVEFQILADAHGNVIHLLERECSIQRRHQKIIEETPSTALTPKLREEMGKAAVAAARASGYVNAGTVEFLVDHDSKFYFLEVNTRLQVEHPITEMITGIDLVRQQIEIAAGNPLKFSQADIVGRGHAIECRIYAEDPMSAFLPSSGKITFVREPCGPGIRNDSGVYSGYTVPMEYDPILSKLITHAESRQECIDRMMRALKDYVVLGVLTPIPFLMDILSSEAFIKGETYTDFIDTHFTDWRPAMEGVDLACVAYIVDNMVNRRTKSNLIQTDGEAYSPWQTLGNFRP